MKVSRIVQHKICVQIKKPLHCQSIFILCNTRVSLHFKKLKLTRSQKDQFFLQEFISLSKLKSCFESSLIVQVVLTLFKLLNSQIKIFNAVVFQNWEKLQFFY